MKFPRFLWIKILKIKSAQEWKDQLNHHHKLLNDIFIFDEYAPKMLPSTLSFEYASPSIHVHVEETRERTTVTRYILIKPSSESSGKLWIPKPEEFEISFPRTDRVWTTGFNQNFNVLLYDSFY